MSDAAPPDADRDVDTRTDLASRLWRCGIVVHLVLYGSILVVLLAIGPADSSFTSDEGAYLLQVELLDDGRWDLDYPIVGHDPEGTFFPIINSDPGDGEWFPYVKHPLYVHLLDASIGVFGVAVGSHLWSVLGALGAAAAAWYLAGAFEPRLRQVAFWCAAASPLLANSQMVWAHALSAAVGGAATVLVVRSLQDDRLPGAHLAGVAALLALGVLLRAEGMLWACALLAVWGVVWWRRRGWRPVVGVGAVAAVVVVAFAAERAWRTSIVGGTSGTVPDSASDSAGGWLESRLEAATDLFTRGAELDPAAAGVAVLALIFVALAALSWRLGRARGESIILLTVGLALLAVRYVGFDDDPITGLFVAWPVVLVALLVSRRAWFTPTALVLAGAVGVFVAAVVVTQWSDAGGVQWGARYLSPAVPALAALSALALRGRSDEEAARSPNAALRSAAAHRRPFPSAWLAVLLLIPALGAAYVPEQLRWFHADLVADATSTDVETIISGQGSLPRFAWDTHDDIDWYLVVDDRTLGDLLDALAGEDVTEVAVVSLDVDPENLDGWEVVSDEGGIVVLRRSD